MKRSNKLMLKVCGMKDPENYLSLLKLAPDYIGLIFYAKSPRYVGNVAPKVLPVQKGIKRVGVFVNERTEIILDQVHMYDLSVVQLHGNETPSQCKELRAAGCTVWKAIGIDESISWEALGSYLNAIDAFLFDTKSPQHGGTGRSFDWKTLTDYPYSTPYFLGGGLRPDNIMEAANIADSRLIGLDLNSGFERSPGLKSITLLKETFEQIRNEQVSS